MKLINSILLLFLCTTASAQLKKIDRSTNNLQGPVKSVTTVYFRAEEKFGDLTKQFKEMTETEEYNKDGLLTSSKLVAGSSTEKISYKYDKAGNLIERKKDEDGEITTIQAVYNAENKETEVNTFDKTGALETKLKKKYDAQGLLLSANLYNGDGTLREKEIFTYDSNQHVSKKSIVTAEGKERSYILYSYTAKGLLKEEIVFTFDELLSFVYWVYQYDNKDRLILKKKSLPDATNFEDTKIEYDAFGNPINEYTNDKNYQKDKYTYDNRNNWTVSLREWFYLLNKRKYFVERTIKYY
jgi:YD repeat-containing protein